MNDVDWVLFPSPRDNLRGLRRGEDEVELGSEVSMGEGESRPTRDFL